MSGGVLVMAGGTGGHVQPALAVAKLLRTRGVAVEWLGTAHGIESRLVPAAGFPLHRIDIRGLRRGGIRGWATAPAMLVGALAAARALLRELRPAVALGMGGYACGPGAVAAWLARIPLVLHEQNAVPGLTNRVLAPLAARLLEAFPGSFPRWRNAHFAGNPVRAEIAAIETPRERLAGRTGPLRLLVVGGSQGARFLNRTVPVALARCAAEGVDVDVLHQAGVGEIEDAAAAYRAAGLEAEPVDYIDDMAAAYRWADLALARAGAMTVFELAAAGVAALLVPFPHAVDDHQTLNARHLHERGAAMLLPQSTLDAATLATVIAKLAGDRERLLAMAEHARAVAAPDAAERVAAACMEFCDG